MNALSPRIAIHNVDCPEISDADIKAYANAQTRQLLEHFAPAWGVYGAVHLSAPGPNDWVLELRATPTIAGALGYHDRTPDGNPILYVFPRLCAQCGTSWTSCASHEVLEAMADPFLRRCTQAPDGRIFAMEVCDQVESDTYLIDGVQLSNFNTPANFEPLEADTKFDFLGLQTQAFEVRAGGYAQAWDGKAWSQLGAMEPYRRALADLGLSRGARRSK